MKLNSYKKSSLLAIIILIGAILRLYYATQIIPSLNWDEVSHGFNAYSILLTSKDEWGNTLPIIFRAYGDFKLPVYIYASIPFVATLGLNSLSIRLPSILAGLGSIIFGYLLAKKITKRQDVSLLTALLMAIEPWSLFTSSFAAEANLASALVISGSYFLISSTKNFKSIIPATILLGLSVWTYNSARIFVPLLLIFFPLSNYYLLKPRILRAKPSVVIGMIVPILLFAGMLMQLLSSSGQARYSWVRLIDEGAISQINMQRNSSKLPSNFSRLLYNKATYFAQKFTSNYLSHFSPQFLFTRGGSHYQFSVPNHGILYKINLIFLFIGLYTLITHCKSNKKYLFVLAWLLLGPVPSALTKDSPHVLRSLLTLPMPQLISALGMAALVDKFKKSRTKMDIPAYALILILLFLSVENYVDTSINNYKNKFSWAWQYGYKQLVDLTKKNFSNYDAIFVTKKYGEPHEFILFYWPWDPESYRSDPLLDRYFQTNWYWVDGFSKFRFINDWEIKDNLTCPTNNKCLLITSPDNKPLNWSKINQINFLDSQTAFEIYDQRNY